MTKKPVRLTPTLLKKIIEEEVEKFGDMDDVTKRAKETEETEPDELADSLDKHIDFMKALKIEEGRLTRRLGRVREALRQNADRIVGSKKA